MSEVVVVTGAAGALGKSIAAFFLDLGATIVAVDLHAAVLHAAYGSNAKVRVVAVDLTDADQTAVALQEVLSVTGPARVLCNIAGGFDMGPAVHETEDALWRRLMDLNVATLINACRTVVPGMKAAGRGKIVNVAAASAVSGVAAMGAYCASKSAVARLTEAMAQELGSFGINVNAVAPSVLDTPANRAAMPDADSGKWIALADMSAIVGFLASDHARAINGAVLPVVGPG